jgi:GT2 family glycosyltransferase
MLRTLAASVARLECPYEVIVVDNNSGDGTRDVVDSVSQQTTVAFRYVIERKQGKSHALNCAIAAAQGELLLFTDDDVLVDPAWATEMVEAATRSSSLCFAGRILADWGGAMPQWYQATGPLRLMDAIVRYDLGDRAIDTHLPPYGATVAFRKTAFERFGYYRTDLGPTGVERVLGEDTELCRRLLSGGESIAYVPTAVVVHPVEPHRATRAYFQRWYFNHGRASIRLSVNAHESKRVWGIPRYLIRSFGESAVRWAFAMSSRARFYHRLQCYQTAGAISESVRLRIASASEQTTTR